MILFKCNEEHIERVSNSIEQYLVNEQLLDVEGEMEVDENQIIIDTTDTNIFDYIIEHLKSKDLYKYINTKFQTNEFGDII